MRIGSLTPSFDPRDPPWDRIINFPDGRFYQFGSRRLNISDYRITYVLISHLPHHMVVICGRSLKPKQNHADFLSIRLGSERVKYVELSLEWTAHLTIKADGSFLIERKKVSYSEYQKKIPQITSDSISGLKITNGALYQPTEKEK